MSTQLDCSIGLSAAEPAYGTAATVSKFVEFIDESLDWNPTFMQGQGQRVGSRVARAGRRVLGKQMAGGDVTIEAPSKGLGALLKAALGAVTTTQRAATGVYQQNHTLATTDAIDSYTIQKGTPPVGGGATSAETFLGAVCTAMEISLANSEILKVKTSWNAREVRTDIAYAAPSYPGSPFEIFKFVGGAITIGGVVTAPTTTALASGGTTVANIRDFSVAVDNGLDDAGFNIGGAGKRSRKPVVGIAPVTGQVTAEYSDNTLRDALLAQTHLNLVLTFLGSTPIGSGSDVPALQIVVPDFVFEGELPKAASGAPIAMSMPFTGMDNLTQPPIQVCYVSTDTAP